MSTIHSSSVVTKEVELSPDVEIGPFCYVRGRTRLGAGTKLESNVSIGSAHGIVEIGRNCVFYEGCVIGAPPGKAAFGTTEAKVMLTGNVSVTCTTAPAGR